MGRKTQIQPFMVIEDGDMSSGSHIESLPTHCKQTDVVQYVVNCEDGQATNGEITVEASFDGKSWFPLDFGALINLDGASGNHQIIIQQVSFSDIRLNYDKTNPAATGTFTAEIFCTTKGA